MQTKLKLDEAEEKRRGEMIADVLALKMNSEGRYNTNWGTKTPLGLFRTMQRIVIDGE